MNGAVSSQAAGRCVRADGHRGAGARLDALRFSLGANASHGKRREAGDYSRAYERAPDHELVDPNRRSRHARATRWATTLTEAPRDNDIAERQAAGQSERTIAQETGLPKSTMQDVSVRKRSGSQSGRRAGRTVSGPKTNTSQMDHPAEPKPTAPCPTRI